MRGSDSGIRKRGEGDVKGSASFRAEKAKGEDGVAGIQGSIS